MVLLARIRALGWSAVRKINRAGEAPHDRKRIEVAKNYSTFIPYWNIYAEWISAREVSPRRRILDSILRWTSVGRIHAYYRDTGKAKWAKGSVDQNVSGYSQGLRDSLCIGRARNSAEAGLAMGEVYCRSHDRCDFPPAYSMMNASGLEVSMTRSASTGPAGSSRQAWRSQNSSFSGPVRSTNSEPDSLRTRPRSEAR